MKLIMFTSAFSSVYIAEVILTEATFDNLPLLLLALLVAITLFLGAVYLSGDEE